MIKCRVDTQGDLTLEQTYSKLESIDPDKVFVFQIFWEKAVIYQTRCRSEKALNKLRGIEWKNKTNS